MCIYTSIYKYCIHIMMNQEIIHMVYMAHCHFAYVLCVNCISPLPTQIRYIIRMSMQFSLLAKDLVIWQLRYISFCQHDILAITYMFHLTFTSSGRDQFNLIASKGYYTIVTNVDSITLSEMMRKLFR